MIGLISKEQKGGLAFCKRKVKDTNKINAIIDFLKLQGIKYEVIEKSENNETIIRVKVKYKNVVEVK